MIRQYQKSILIVLAVALGLFFFSGYFNGYRLKKSIQASVGIYSGTGLQIGGAYINGFTGNGYLKDITIANPPGFFGKHALAIDRIDIKGGPTSLHGETIELQEIHIQGVEIYILTSKGGNNFVSIFKNSYRGARPDYGIKNLELDRFILDPVTIYLGPKVMNQNPYKTTLSTIEIGKSDYESGRWRSFLAVLGNDLIEDIQMRFSNNQIPVPIDDRQAFQNHLEVAQSYLDKYLKKQ